MRVDIVYANVQSFRSKFLDFEVLINEIQCRCFCLSEHWLTIDKLETLRLDGYSVASGFCRSVKIHGGVAIYVRNDVKFVSLELERFSEEVHCEVSGIFLGGEGLQLVTVYRSPDGDLNRYLEIMERVLDRLNFSKRVVVTGDFNVHFNRDSDRDVNKLLNFFSSYGLIKTVSFVTRGDECLDNVFTNMADDVCSVDLVRIDHLSDHQHGILFSYYDSTFQPKKVRINSRPITSEGLFSLYREIEGVDWSFVSDRDTDVDAKFKRFVDIIREGVMRCFPIKSRLVSCCSSKKGPVNWFTDDLKAMRERLNTFVRMNKTYPEFINKEIVKSLRKQYKREILKAKQRANDHFIENSTNPQAAMWKVISGRRIRSGQKTSQLLNAEMLNQFFVGVADDIVRGLPESTRTFHEYLSGQPQTTTFEFREVTYCEVRQAICSLKNSNSRDCYDMDTKLVKTLRELIVYPLTKLINQCMDINIFPSVLKLGKVIPLYKNKGSADDIANYRPISILPVFSKVYESILKIQIVDYFEGNGLLLECQFGFRKNKSTTLAIDSLTKCVLNGFERTLDTHASFLDLTKAFDCVSHDILVSKLKHYNFSSGSCALVRSYLSNRCQYVNYSHTNSATLSIRHGVPQGSVLGPLLFIIYINDMKSSLRNTTILPQMGLFADDTCYYFNYHPSQDIRVDLDQVQSGLQDWFLANKLSLNNSKTQTINFSLRKIYGGVSHSEGVKFLGVHLDSDLSWEEHVLQLGKKLSRVIFLIRNLSGTVTPSMLLMAYHGYFSSAMSYAVLNWGHSAHASVVFGLQRRCVRIVGGLGYRDCCRRCFVGLGILTFPCVYIYQCLLYIKSNMGNFMMHCDVHGYSTRNNMNIVPSFRRLSKTRDGTGYMCIKFFNVLPPYIRELELKCFRKIIKKYLISKAFFSTTEYLQNSFDDMVL